MFRFVNILFGGESTMAAILGNRNSSHLALIKQALDFDQDNLFKFGINQEAG